MASGEDIAMASGAMHDAVLEPSSPNALRAQTSQAEQARLKLAETMAEAAEVRLRCALVETQARLAWVGRSSAMPPFLPLAQVTG